MLHAVGSQFSLRSAQEIDQDVSRRIYTQSSSRAYWILRKKKKKNVAEDGGPWVRLQFLVYGKFLSCRLYACGDMFPRLSIRNDYLHTSMSTLNSCLSCFFSVVLGKKYFSYIIVGPCGYTHPLPHTPSSCSAWLVKHRNNCIFFIVVLTSKLKYYRVFPS
jgi:hypothetical protein